MKKLLYFILKKDMIKKLSEKHGEQFIDNVMETFGIPTNLLGRNTKKIDPEYKKAMELYIDGLKIQQEQLSKEYQFIREDQSLVRKRLDLLANESAHVLRRIKSAENEIYGMNVNHDENYPVRPDIPASELVKY